MSQTSMDRLERWLACGLAALVCAAISGCASEPSAPRHGVPLPPAFDAAASVKASSLDRWWTRFGVAELSSLVDRADAGNFDIAAAVARIQEADAQARVAGAALLPTLNGAATGARSQSSGTSAGGGLVRAVSLRSNITGFLSTSYELDIWGRNRDLLRSAESQTEAAVYARDVVRLSTQGATVIAYLQYAAAQDRLVIAQGNLRNAERILSVIRDRLSAGTGTALDLAQQESLLALQRAAIPPLRQNADLARTTIALLLGRPPEKFAVRAPSLERIRTPAITPGLPASLLVRRPDIRNVEAQLSAADANVDAARKAMLPTIQLTGQGGLQSAAFSTLFRPESAIWSLAAGLVQPIFDGGRLEAQSDAAIAQRQALLELYRKSIVSALVDVENALVAIRENTAREAAQRIAIAKASEAFRLSEERLRLGTIDLQTLLSTQVTLFQSQDTLVQIRLARLESVVSLYQALGGDIVTRPVMVTP